MFVGRDQELNSLENLYNENSFQMVVLYGRRRIGKTTLISKFLANHDGIFFTAQEASDKINLQEFSKKIYHFFHMPTSIGGFDSWNTAFDYIGKQAGNSQFVLAFDEFPYAAAENKGLRSILQNCIDHQWKDTKLFVILCGSHVAFMENEVLGYKSPLFGRRTAQIKLDEFDYYDAAKLLSDKSNEEKIMYYSCIGGTPHYLSQIRQTDSFESNIKRLFFDISGYLYSEPMMLLQQELREPAMYNSIVLAVAGGASRLSEIAAKVSEDASKVNKYLQVLLNLGIVKKIYPFGENRENSRKGIYQVADNCYRFWYRFVFLNRPEIEGGNGDFIADEEVLGEATTTFIGHSYEQIALQYLNRLNRNHALPFRATRTGCWWGNDPLQRKQTDVDVIMGNKKTGNLLLGECKWHNHVDYEKEIRKLLEKGNLFPEYEEKFYYFFCKHQPDKNIISFAESNHVHIVNMDALFQIDRIQQGEL